MAFALHERFLADTEAKLGARLPEGFRNRMKKANGGELELQPHKYVEGGRYLVYLSPQRADSGLRIVFETDGSVVTRFRAGVLPAVAYVEGCS